MNFKPRPIEIPPNDPFESDRLNRKGEIENLTRLIQNLDSPAVLAINSRWGTGKTTFIKLWEQYLKSEKCPSLYFNAWETDFSDDPLVAFLGEMNESFESRAKSSKKYTKAWGNVKEAGKQLVRQSLPALIRVMSAGVIDANKTIETEAADVVNALAGYALNNYLKQKTAIDQFKKSLSTVITEPKGRNPIVIFVDELDRCKPTYAIALLERIKHLFNIKGLIFVLALDKLQLGHSIRAIYGSDFDTDGYLRRFIDFEYQLQCPDKESYIDSLFESLSIKSFLSPRNNHSRLGSDYYHLKSTLSCLASALDLSLREIEQITSCINLSIRTIKDHEDIHPALLIFLTVIKNKEPRLYQNYIKEASSNEENMGYCQETINYLHKILDGIIKHYKETSADNNPSVLDICVRIEAHLIAAKFSVNQPEPTKSIIQQILDRSNKFLGEEYSNRVSLSIQEMEALMFSDYYNVNLKELVERINLLSQFQFTHGED